MITKNPSHLHWLDQNFTTVNDYLYSWVDEFSRGGLWTDPIELATPGTVRYDFIWNPGLGKQVIKDWKDNTKSVEIHQQKLLRTIKKEETYVILLTGMGGSGKGSSAWWLLDQLREDFNIKVVLPVKSDADALPEWAEPITNIMDMAAGDIVLYDEAGVRSSSRRSMSKENENSTAWLPVGRHSGAKVVYVTQFSAIADKNISRFTNVHISKGFSTSAFGQDDMERATIAKNPIYAYFQIDPEDRDYARVPSTNKDWGIVMTGGGSNLTYLPMPGFYTEKLSKPFSKYIDKAGGSQADADKLAMADANQMLADGQSAATIWQETYIRGFRKSKEFWRIFTGEDKSRRGDDYFD
ncbi:MAG: hypothetical protein PHP06_05985 [Clostridia bacterium]|nr:hypothetical protein [Clostridia bacterium]